MQSSIFYVRSIGINSTFESFINQNQIIADQIVSITGDSAYYGSNRYNYSRSIYFFYEGELKFDLFKNLQENRKIEILSRVLKLESNTEKEERLGSQRTVNETYKFYYSEADFNDFIQNITNDKNEAINIIFPAKKEDEPQEDLEYIQLLKTLNPEIEIPLSYPIPEEKPTTA
jgi:hypothetical protein